MKSSTKCAKIIAGIKSGKQKIYILEQEINLLDELISETSIIYVNDIFYLMVIDWETVSRKGIRAGVTNKRTSEERITNDILNSLETEADC